MPISWTAEVDQRLFQSTMDVCGIIISSRQYDEIAERMGEGFTAEALKHRFRKIKAQAGAGDGKSGSSSPRKAATPKANKTSAAPASKSSNKTPRSSARKRNAKNYAEPATDEEGADDEEEKIPESPTKKVKKEQEDDEDGSGNGAESYFDQPEQV